MESATIQRPKRISLDNTLLNALTPGHVCLISGKVGTGKTTIATQFLIEGAEKGKKGAIIKPDETSDRVNGPGAYAGNSEYMKDVHAFSFEFEEYEKSGMIRVFGLADTYRLSAMKKMTLNGYNDMEEYTKKLTDSIMDQVENIGIRNLAIDPVTPLLTDSYDLTHMLINALAEAMPKVRIIMTSGIRANHMSWYGVEEYAADMLIVLDKGEYTDDRIATIKKVRYSSYDPTPFAFRITKDGIVTPNRREGDLLRPVLP